MMMPPWFWPAICVWLVACGVAAVAFAVAGSRAAGRRAEIVRTSKTSGGSR